MNIFELEIYKTRRWKWKALWRVLAFGYFYGFYNLRILVDKEIL